jgi:TRAP-type C4-dicarboxylate transport system substrate-binding protein
MEASYGQEWFFKDDWDPKNPAANFKGKRVRSPGILACRIFLNWLGAEQISMSAPEAYEAGQKGIIQGCTLGFSQYTHSHTYEVFPKVMFANTTFNAPGGVACVFRLNLWNQLPENMQAAIEKVSQEMQRSFFTDYRKEVDRLRENLVKEGKIKQFVTLDPKIKAKWVTEFNSVLDEGMKKKFPKRWPEVRNLIMKYQK